MTTKDLEMMLGISKATLIYYEKEEFIKPKRDNNNYRNYSIEDIEMIKFILLMRSMEVSIDEIKLILNNQLSIRDVLDKKREYVENQHLKLEEISEKIKEYTKRHRVKYSFDEDKKDIDVLYLNNDSIQFFDIIIHIKDIKCIKISMYSEISLFTLVRIFMDYYIDLDIVTDKDTYSFDIRNKINEMYDMFQYFIDKNIEIDDCLGLVKLYQNIKDPVKLNNYINLHFRKWSKQYGLDNPRSGVKNLSRENYLLDSQRKSIHQFK